MRGQRGGRVDAGQSMKMQQWSVCLCVPRSVSTQKCVGKQTTFSKSWTLSCVFVWTSSCSTVYWFCKAISAWSEWAHPQCDCATVLWVSFDTWRPNKQISKIHWHVSFSVNTSEGHIHAEPSRTRIADPPVWCEEKRTDSVWKPVRNDLFWTTKTSSVVTSLCEGQKRGRGVTETRDWSHMWSQARARTNTDWLINLGSFCSPYSECSSEKTKLSLTCSTEKEPFLTRQCCGGTRGKSRNKESDTEVNWMRRRLEIMMVQYQCKLREQLKEELHRVKSVWINWWMN